jgi:hypothetical protein
MKSWILFIAQFFVLNIAQAQDSVDTQGPTFPKGFQLEAYVEAYYTFASNRNPEHLRPAFLYNHKRSHEVNLNFAFIRVGYFTEWVRASVALMEGNYARYNVSELANLYEGYAGIRLNKTVWVDAGIMASHIGFESLISGEGWTLTRSMAAENSPYYHGAAKITHTSLNEKWLLSALYINGWQRSVRTDGNFSPAGGIQIQRKTNNGWLLNYSNFLGNDKPDSSTQIRVFHNFYGKWENDKGAGLILGVDVGAEQSPDRQSWRWWYTPQVVLRKQLNEKHAIAGRLEYYYDPNLIVAGVDNGSRLNIWGLSINGDWEPSHWTLFRLEGKTYVAGDEKPFLDNGAPRNFDVSLTAAISARF